MKKFISKIMVMVLIITSIQLPTFADEITVKLDGAKILFDVSPRIINERTMVPLRAIFEALGATVEWNQEEKTVVSEKDDTTVIATIGQNVMKVNGEKKYMDIAPVVIDDRTLVPVRFIAEAFGCDVDWDQDSLTVDIESNEEQVQASKNEDIVNESSFKEENDDTYENATLFELNSSLNDSLYCDRIVDEWDGEDWYKIVLPYDGLLEIGCVADNADIYTTLELYCKDGDERLARMNDKDKRLSITKGLEAGEYYIKYSIGLSSTIQTNYEIDNTFTKQPLGNEPIGKGSYQKAIEIYPGETKEGHIGYTSDEGEIDRIDWYKFILEKEDKVNIEYIADENVWTTVSLMDKNGDDTICGDYGSDMMININKELPAGTYYIKIEGSIYRDPGGYTLSLYTSEDQSSVSIATPEPTIIPTIKPTEVPEIEPTVKPTVEPTETPSTVQNKNEKIYLLDSAYVSAYNDYGYKLCLYDTETWEYFEWITINNCKINDKWRTNPIDIQGERVTVKKDSNGFIIEITVI